MKKLFDYVDRSTEPVTPSSLDFQPVDKVIDTNVNIDNKKILTSYPEHIPPILAALSKVSPATTVRYKKINKAKIKAKKKIANKSKRINRNK